MTYRYILHPIAQKEYRKSVEWYLERSEKAASNFVQAAEKRFLIICKDPKRFKNEYRHYYETTLKKFPFTIIYAIVEERQLIVIIAIYHQKREPANKYR
jgi:plasmid stabilization system protein ParE